MQVSTSPTYVFTPNADRTVVVNITSVPSASIPTLSECGVTLMAGLLLSAAAWIVTRRAVVTT